MIRFVPNAPVRLLVAHEELLIGKCGELVEEKGETCIVNFGDDVKPDNREVRTSDLEAVFADDEWS